MNCDNVHRRLLALERPDAPPADVKKHLADCAACRAWQEQLVGLERDIPFVPVPPPQRRTQFLRTLRESPLAPARPHLYRPSLNGRRERGQRKVAIAVALAASLLVVALGAWLWNPDPNAKGDNVRSVPPKSQLDERLNQEARWADARTSQERVSILNELALSVESNTLSQVTSADEVRKQIGLYKEVIDRLTSQEAPQLKSEMQDSARKKLLQPIALRLQEVESKAKWLAKQRHELADALAELSHIAAEGDRKLRPLYA